MCVHAHTRACTRLSSVPRALPAAWAVLPQPVVRPGGARRRPVVWDGLGEEGRSAAPLAARREGAGSRWGCREKGGVQPQPCPQSPPGPGCLVITPLLTPVLGPGARCRHDRLQGAPMSPGVWEGTGSARQPAEQRGRGSTAWGGTRRGRLPGQPPVRPDGQPSAVPPPPARPGLVPPQSWWRVLAPCAAWQARQAGGLGAAPRREASAHSLARPAGPRCVGPPLTP